MARKTRKLIDDDIFSPDESLLIALEFFQLVVACAADERNGENAVVLRPFNRDNGQISQNYFYPDGRIITHFTRTLLAFGNNNLFA